MIRLGRTFEAVVFDWDGTAVPDRHSSARAVRRRVEQLCARGLDVAVVSETSVGNVDGRLQARPGGPGRLWLAVNRGSELFVVDTRGPRTVERRIATRAESAALDRAAELVCNELATNGLATRIVSSWPNCRTIDLIPAAEWTDPPEAQIAVLLDAVTARLRTGGIPGLAAVVELAQRAGKEAGLADPRVTCDVKHVSIGLTDKSDSMRTLLGQFGARGVGPGLVLLVGDAFGALGGVPGSDSFLLAERVTAVSVGVEPNGTPADVRHLGGGPAVFRGLLDEQLHRRVQRRVPSVDPDPEWTLAFHDGDPRLARTRETLLSLGDGVIGIRGSSEEPNPDERPLVLAGGVYTAAGPDEHLLPGPTPLQLQAPPAPERRRVLDLRTGVLLREPPDGEDGLRTCRFVAAHHHGLLALRVEGPAAPLTAEPVLTATGDQPSISGRSDDITWARSSDGRGGIAAATAQSVSRAGRLRTVERLTAYTADGRRPPPPARAVTAVRRAQRHGWDRLASEQRAAWARRWREACVWIPDDPNAQLATRFALFQLWNTVATSGEAAVGARGLSGSGYAGHVFWDADVFVLPAIVSMAPTAARAMLDYRLRRLPAARQLAHARGYDGARFPWESASLGDDVTPTAGQIGEAWVPILTGQLEEHITADVAWAAAHYAAWTGDDAFLRGPARPLLHETARYWASRITVDPDGSAHLRHVIGPDEYHDDVDDNAYTNVMARWNLRAAAASTPDDPEAGRWRQLADSLVDGYDLTTRRHEQFHGYHALQQLLVADVGRPPLAADLLLGPERTSRSQIIKQPDVLMAHHLLPAEMPTGSLAADLDYYLPRTAHGSSLSPAITAAVLARAGRPDEALAHLDLALRLDLDDLTGMTSAGLHVATLGGVWQALLSGFAGVQVSGNVLSVDPQLPSRWSTLRLRFRCLGRCVEIAISPQTTLVSTDRPLTLATPGGTTVRVNRHAQLTRSDTGWVVLH